MAVGFRWLWPALSRRPPQSGLPWPRFPSPLIEPDVPISGIRLSDWLLRKAHGGRPLQAGVSRRHRGT